jgi:hypothetical protein
MEESYLMQTLGNVLYWTKAIYPQDPNIDETIKENGEMLLNAYLKSAITAAFKWNTDFELWGESEKESKENLFEFLTWIRAMSNRKSGEHTAEYIKLKLAITSIAISLFEEEELTESEYELVKSKIFNTT